MTAYPPLRPEPSAAVRRLVGLCARPALDSAAERLLSVALRDPPDGVQVLSFAEGDGMTPLLARHLGARELPELPRQTLVGVRLRQRAESRAQQEVLEQVAATLAGLGIRLMPLKGAALSRMVYADPADRPMGDLDLLVAPEEAGAAYAHLTRGGFAPVPGRDSRQHLDVVAVNHRGVEVRVELHHRALWSDERQQLPRLWDRGVEVDGLSGARAAEPLVLLWQVFHHAFRSQIHWVPFRLIWVADVVGILCAHAAAIDWPRGRAEYGSMTRALSLLGAVTPLPAAAVEACGAAPRLRRERATYRGWPRQPLAGAGGLRLGVAAETLWPSPWWLALRYGLGTSLPRRAVARALHLAHLASHAWL